MGGATDALPLISTATCAASGCPTQNESRYGRPRSTSHGEPTRRNAGASPPPPVGPAVSDTQNDVHEPSAPPAVLPAPSPRGVDGEDSPYRDVYWSARWKTHGSRPPASKSPLSTPTFCARLGSQDADDDAATPVGMVGVEREDELAGLPKRRAEFEAEAEAEECLDVLGESLVHVVLLGEGEAEESVQVLLLEENVRGSQPTSAVEGSIPIPGAEVLDAVRLDPGQLEVQVSLELVRPGPMPTVVADVFTAVVKV